MHFSEFVTLRRGMKGRDVATMQAVLALCRYLTSRDIDGDFGPTTEAAVKKFNAEKLNQSKNVMDEFSWFALTSYAASTYGNAALEKARATGAALVSAYTVTPSAEPMGPPAPGARPGQPFDWKKWLPWVAGAGVAAVVFLGKPSRGGASLAGYGSGDDTRFAKGTIQRIHPASDWFMRGETHGRVTSVKRENGRVTVYLRGERSNKRFKLSPDYILPHGG